MLLFTGGGFRQVQGEEGPAGAQPASVEERIRSALEHPTEFDFQETALDDAIVHISTVHGIPIRLNKKALDDAAIDTNTPVTRKLKGIRLRSALRLMLGELDLAYVIRDEALEILTKEAAATVLQTRVYPVGDLVRGRVGEPDFDSLTEAIMTVVDPSSWTEVGGPGSLKAMQLPRGDVLICTQTEEVHEQIAGFLAVLRKAQRQEAEGAAPARYAPLLVNAGVLDAQIRNALLEPTEIDVVEKALHDVLTSLSRQHNIPIELDKKALDDAAIGIETPVTFKASRRKLQSALQAMLRELDLAAVIHNDVLLITTKDAADNTLLQVRVYPVGDLVRGPLGKPDFDSVTETIKDTIAPTSWEKGGGPGSVEGVQLPRADILICSQTEEVHEQIAALLTDLRRELSEKTLKQSR